MKLKTLNLIKSKIKKSKIPNFNNNSKDEGLSYPVIIRSNFEDEDQEKTNAGKYCSYICNNKKEFKECGKNYFTQEYIDNADWYGVVFTVDLKTGSPYYFINIDKNQGTVTSGGNCEKQIVVYKNYKSKNKITSKIIQSCKEIEELLGCSNLDIEFAFKDGNVYIFQVRKMPTKALEINLDETINQIKIKSQYSIMSDWNPAEMIGVIPDLSVLKIYKNLITDVVWSKRRKKYGYKNVKKPLMIDFYGRPYIDVKRSFQSLIPQKISKKTSKKLLEFYLKKFKNNPHLHDKIEFDIVYSCYTPNIELKNFSIAEQKEIKENLLQLTNNIVLSKFYEKEAKLLKQFKENPKLDILKYASEPFSGVARLAFIATQLLKTLFTQKQQEKLFESLKTITKKMSRQITQLKKEDFIKKYGHLRPGTYDKKSLNYKDGYDDYFREKDIKISITKKYKLPCINKKLKEIGYKFNTRQLESFIRNSICLREYGKFVLSIGINDLISKTKEEGKNKIGELINLPPVITCKKDCFEYEFKASPNFIGIGFKKIKPTFIERADPGYDWIFTKKIQGLVTKYGGCNSHMALRCHELGIPAIIGCGEELFEKWNQWNFLEIDFDSKKVSGK